MNLLEQDCQEKGSGCSGSALQSPSANQLTPSAFVCILPRTGADGRHLGYDPPGGYCNSDLISLLSEEQINGNLDVVLIR